MDLGLGLGLTASRRARLNPLLLAQVGSALAAYALRPLSATYAGPLLRIQRSSDSTQLDIYAAGTQLDEAALTAFVGAGNGDVVKLYDQSGNGYDQAISGGTLRLVAAGVINRGPNNLPRAAATSAWFAASATISATLPVSMHTVAKRTAGTATGFFGSAAASPTNTNTLWYGFETLDRYGAYVGDGTASAPLTQTGSAADAGSVRSYATFVTASTMVQAIDGTFSASVVRAQRAITTWTPSIGTQYRTLTGDWYEAVIYGRTLSPAEWDAVHLVHASVYSLTVKTRGGLTAIPTLILAGQSNAAGRAPMANLPVAYQGPQAGVSIWTGSAFATLDSTLNNNQLGETASAKFAWEMAVGHDYLARTGNPAIYLVKYAVGGTPLARNTTNPSWDPTWYTTSGNALFSMWLTHYWSAVIAMQAAGYSPDLRACQWYQGEQDGTDATWSANYQSNLTAFIAAVRACVGVATLPVHLMRIANECPETYAATIRTAQAAVAGAISGVTMVDVDAFSMLDADHLDAGGQIALGTTLAGLL